MISQVFKGEVMVSLDIYIYMQFSKEKFNMYSSVIHANVSTGYS